MKKLAIFDFDGTLVNSVDDVVICFNKTLAELNFPTLTYREYIERLGGNIDEIVSLILKDRNTPENIELVKSAYEKNYADLDKENTLPFPKVKDVLKELMDKNILLAINSNRKNDSLHYFADKLFKGIDFVDIKGHDPAYPSKPMPYAVEKIMHDFNISKEDALYIGDSMTDIKTAENAEIDCLIVKWGYGSQSAYENDYPLDVIEDAYQILEYF